MACLIDGSKLLNQFNLDNDSAQERYIALVKAPTIPAVSLELMAEALVLLEIAVNSIPHNVCSKACENFNVSGGGVESV